MYRIYYCLLFFFYSSTSFAQNTPALVPFQHTDGSYGYKDESGRTAIEPQFEAAQVFRGAYAGAKVKGLWGLITSRGKWAVPATYEDIGWTSEEEVPAVSGEITGYKQQGKWGIISVKNKILTPPVYDIAAYFSQEYIKVGKITTQFQQTDTLFGLIDAKGKEIIPLAFHSLAVTPHPGILRAGINTLYKNNMPVQAYGLVSTTNKVLLPLAYRDISPGKPGTFKITPFYTWHWTDAKGQMRGKVAADSLYEISQNIFAFTWEDKAGIYTSGTSTLQATLQHIYPEKHGYIMFRSQNNYGLLTRKGDTLQTYLPPVYDSLYILSGHHIKAATRQQGRQMWELISASTHTEQPVKSQSYQFIDEIKDSSYIRVSRDRQYGFINSTGQPVIPLEFDSLGTFTDSVCVAVQAAKAGILKKDGTWHLQPAAESYQVSKAGYFIRQEKGKWEVLDRAGKKLYSSTIPLHFLADGSIELKQKGKVGRLSPAGVPCVPALYDSIGVMSGEGTFWAFQGKNIFLYDREGNLLVKEPGRIEYITYVPNGYSLVRTGGKYGYVDERGRLRISNRYEGAQPFSEGLAAVRLGGKWGFVNTHDKIAIQPYYEEVTSFKNGFAIARKGKKWGLIDKNGKETTNFVYDHIIRDKTGVFITEKGGNQGLLGKNGVEGIYVKYTQLTPFPDGNARMQIQNKYGLVSGKGIVLLPAAYDAIFYNSYSQTYLMPHKPATLEVTAQQILSGEMAKLK